MAFPATHHPRSRAGPRVIGPIPIVEAVDGWQIEDDGETVAQVYAYPGWEHSARVYANRIAELLERHGLADVPEAP